MKIISAEFIKSAVKPDQYPKAGMPEIAFTGRSNVGKSSLINTLLGRRKLAQTSATPGKTRLINFFTVNEKLSFVDLPGYGFAKVSRAEQEKWGPMIETYLRERLTLRLVVSILDVRHDPTQQDRDLIEWLRHYGRNHLIVLTKSDKISRGEAMRRRRQIMAHLGLGEHEIPVLFSAQSGEGKGELWKAIDRVLRAGDESIPGSGQR
jgi:GTP-binding protein